MVDMTVMGIHGMTVTHGTPSPICPNGHHTPGFPACMMIPQPVLLVLLTDSLMYMHTMDGTSKSHRLITIANRAAVRTPPHPYHQTVWNVRNPLQWTIRHPAQPWSKFENPSSELSATCRFLPPLTKSHPNLSSSSLMWSKTCTEEGYVQPSHPLTQPEVHHPAAPPVTPDLQMVAPHQARTPQLGMPVQNGTTCTVVNLTL